jgi:PIN domain nuclease of toxin-antitoxin system
MSDLYLLDTHVLLWAVAQPHRLGADVQTLIKNNEYTVSVASFWELINKKGRRDAPVKDPSAWWERYVTRQRTPVLPIRTAHVAHLEHLPELHKDPYDRILMAQSVVERMPLVTSDEEIRRYGIQIVVV